MKPILYFGTLEIPKSELKNSTLPDIREGKILQNNLEFRLNEDAEIYERYGTRNNTYPYTQQNNYTRKTRCENIKTAILENDFLKATFLPELGGRLWSLLDKESGKNLLYTNDVIRFSNLASRNAWFSGGVEWNIGIIGHSPFTNEPLYCAVLEDETGNPVLRMYEYERIRQVCYQMDFWLRQDSKSLNCRMRITNETEQVLPMYWWSNIAVPEFKNGCVLTPADQAFAYRNENGKGIVECVKIPEINGVNVCYYNNIQKQVDYFFDLHAESPKYIANIDANGFGLLHLSTNRLKSRKLFSWGNNHGSNNWQKFLTNNAGRYVEIQAGLAKTQYGCIPMPPHSAWEWMEQYGAIQVNPQKNWYGKQQEATQIALDQFKTENLEHTLNNTKAMAKSKAKPILTGNLYSGFLKDISLQTTRQQTSHLIFAKESDTVLQWRSFLQTGFLHEPSPEYPPEQYFCEKVIFEKLNETIKAQNKDNWYAQYHLGVMMIEQNPKKAKELFLQSWKLKENAWAAHGLAVVYCKEKNKLAAAEWMEKGCFIRLHDISYQKEGWEILLQCEASKTVLQLADSIDSSLKNDSRLKYCIVKAFAMEKNFQKAFELLNENLGLLPDDIREGDDEIERLWHYLHIHLYQTNGEICPKLQMKSL